jgi:hypothetical protein
MGKWGISNPLIPYTIHDNRHSEAVEQKLYSILPESTNLNSHERFFLLASIWLHDIGMSPKLFDNEQNPDDLFQDIDEKINYNKEIRNKHAIRSADFIDKNFKTLGLTQKEASDLMTMVKYHRYSAYKDLYKLDDFSANYPNIRLKLLIAYLRLADAMQVPLPCEMVLPVEFKIFLAYGLDSNSLVHWFKSIYAIDVEPDFNNFSINIKLRRPTPDDEVDWHTLMEPLKKVIKLSLENELDSIKDILITGGKPIFLHVNCECYPDPRMDNEVTNLRVLLNNIELFDETLTPSSSLLMATIQKQIEILIDGPINSSVNYLDNYRKKVISEELTKKRLHSLLIRTNKILIEILEGKSSDSEKIKLLKSFIKGYKVYKKKSTERISQNFIEFINNEFGKDGSRDSYTFLLYGYSGTVIKCIGRFYNTCPGKELNIYICEGRGKTSYRFNNRLLYSDGIKYAEEIAKFRKKGIVLNIQIIPDIAVSHLIYPDSLLADQKPRKIDCILFGANGIGYSGKVSHTLGHLGISDMAAAYKIPVYVIAESAKIHEDIDKIKLQTKHRGNSWLTTDVNFEMKITGMTGYNPRGDIIPPNKITKIITEDDIFFPAKIKTYYKNKNLDLIFA